MPIAKLRGPQDLAQMRATLNQLIDEINAMGVSGAAINQLTGDVMAGPGSGAQAATLETVNEDVGAFTNADITVNEKGLVTAAASGSGGGVIPPDASLLGGLDADFVAITVGSGLDLTANELTATGGGGLEEPLILADVLTSNTSLPPSSAR